MKLLTVLLISTFVLFSSMAHTDDAGCKEKACPYPTPKPRKGFPVKNPEPAAPKVEPSPSSNEGDPDEDDIETSYAFYVNR